MAAAYRGSRRAAPRDAARGRGVPGGRRPAPRPGHRRPAGPRRRGRRARLPRPPSRWTGHGPRTRAGTAPPSGRSCRPARSTGSPRGADQGHTLFSLLFGLFGWLLGTWSNQTRLTVTTPVSLRDAPGAERTVGCFVDTLPVPLDLAAAPTLPHLAAAVQRTVIEALDRPRRPVGAPSGQVSFTVEHRAGPALRLDGLCARPVFCHTSSAKFDLAVRVERSPSGASVLAEYDTGLFDAGTVRRLLDHYAELVVAATRPRARLAPRARAAPRGRPRPPPTGRCSGGWAAARGAGSRRCSRSGSRPRRGRRRPRGQGRRRGDRPGRTVARGGRLRPAARRHGRHPGSLVAVCAPASVDTVVAVVGTLRAGRRSRRSTRATRRPAGRRSWTAAALARWWPRRDWTPAVGAARSCRSRHPGTRATRPGAPGQRTSRRPAPATGLPSSALPGDRPHPAAVAYVTHTSGSTGAPRRCRRPTRDWPVTSTGPYATTAWGPAGRPLFTSLAFDMAITSLLAPLPAAAPSTPSPSPPTSTRRYAARSPATTW
ncbi:condensation domain-containing protein [Streptomyces sp. M19]